MFDIRHDEIVRAKHDIVVHAKCTIKSGSYGTVKTFRKGNDGQAEYLIKWLGKSGPVSVKRDDIERA